MEGWIPMHGELCVLECTDWKALDSFGELWVGVAAEAQSTECDAGLGKKTRERVRGHPARG